MTRSSPLGMQPNSQPIKGERVCMPNVLHDYCQAGCYARLCLWIRCRGLRAEFDEVEALEGQH
jgi:hypothetical protein